MRSLIDWPARLRRQFGDASVGAGVRISPRARIEAKEIIIGANTVIEAGVEMRAEKIAVGAHSYLGARVLVAAPSIELGFNTVLFPGVRLLGLEHLFLGDHAKLSREATIKAARAVIGVEFWMNERAEIGGGGWRNRAGGFFAGDRCHVGRNTHINVACVVRLGDDTAIGMDCTLATHAHWQPITEGYPRHRGPITLGSNVAVYSRAVIYPGVNVADGGTIAASAVVTRDVEARTLVGGIPARVLQHYQRPPDRAALIIALLDELAANLSISARSLVCGSESAVALDLDGEEQLVFSPDRRTLEVAGTRPRLIVLTFDSSLSGESGGARCVFDLERRVVSGYDSPWTERVRNHLFSAGIRFRYEGYRRALLDYHALVRDGID